MDAQDIIRKGTTTIGIVCKDGIVLAADKRVTLGGQLVSNKKIEKIVKITDDIAITTAGMVSDIQLIAKLFKAELNLKKIRTNKPATVKEAANLLAMLVYQNIRKLSPILGVTGFLIGGKDQGGFYLYEIGPDGSSLINDDYATEGSGMVMAFGVLDTLYRKDMTLAEGIRLGVKAINAAMQRDTATGEGVDVITITKDGVKKVLTRRVEYKVEE